MTPPRAPCLVQPAAAAGGEVLVGSSFNCNCAHGSRGRAPCAVSVGGGGGGGNAGSGEDREYAVLCARGHEVRGHAAGGAAGVGEAYSLRAPARALTDAARPPRRPVPPATPGSAESDMWMLMTKDYTSSPGSVSSGSGAEAEAKMAAAAARLALPSVESASTQHSAMGPGASYVRGVSRMEAPPSAAAAPAGAARRPRGAAGSWSCVIS